jgi:hypothetical protein
MARSISGKARAEGRRYTVPGLWEHWRGYLRAEIERGDPRIACDFAAGLTDAKRKRANEAASAGPKRELARMDERGWFEMGRPPTGQFPEAAGVPWLVDRSVARILVYADDSIEPTE